MLYDLSGTLEGSSDLSEIVNLWGFASGSSQLAISEPDRIYGAAVLTAHMEVLHTLPPVYQNPAKVGTRLRWGQPLGPHDLVLQLLSNRGTPMGPVCISYTMYQVTSGYCTPVQVGVGNRKPGTMKLGCYYATGVAGECGQPGLWVIRWKYQRTFGEQPIEKDCYFYVLDSVLCPVPGDTLIRNRKMGWY